MPSFRGDVKSEFEFERGKNVASANRSASSKKIAVDEPLSPQTRVAVLIAFVLLSLARGLLSFVAKNANKYFSTVMMNDNKSELSNEVNYLLT